MAEREEITALETERLVMRPLTWDDLPGLKKILQDRETMRFYEGPMEEEECVAWLQRQLCRYENLGFGPMAVCLRGQREMMGQCGLSLQQGPEGDYLEVGYLLNRAFWHRGYATEAARAVRDHAFEAMNAPSVYSFIREGNIASMNVAIRNGMTIRGAFTKHYRGIDMVHYIFGADNPRRREKGSQA